jgi:hypothetical protein
MFKAQYFKPLAVIFALSLASYAAHAELPSKAGGEDGNAVPSGHVLGAGTDSCETWTKARSKKVSDWEARAQWINGYLTSHSELLYYQKKIDILGVQKIDGFNMLPIIDKYCARNPSQPLIYAAQDFFANAVAGLRQ